ncbi:MAG TPA: peptide ABC transporter substrate-binding protein [Chloroflexota bacterium]|nr:peptide ABC transporter substrate-binding protein [Chloroflexota bacterium]
MLLAACGAASSPSASPTAQPPASASAPASAAVSGKPAASASGAPANTLRYNIGDEPNSIDPAQDQDTDQDFVIMQLNGTLVYPDKNLNVQPGLAEKWDISADGLTYTFHLRQGLKWSDGSPFSAKDFEYSFKRLFDPATASPYTDIVKGIKGGEEYFSSKSKDPAVLQKLRDGVGVKAQDDTTLVITLKEPEAFFLSTLFNGATAPVSQANLEKNKDKAFDAPGFIGTGPFRLQSWQHKSVMQLVPNPNYYGGAPKINLNLAMIPEPTASLAAYKNNEIDTTGQVNLSSADTNALRNDPAYKNQVLQYTELATQYLAYNVTSKPFDNPKVRVAISYAMDRDTLVNKILAGVGTPATSLIPPGMPGHLDGVGQEFDLNKAKQMLAEAGFPGGKGIPPNIQASYNNLGTWPQIMQFFQANLQAIGISIQLDPRESKTYFKEMHDNASPLFRSGWSSDYPDPDDWYRVIFKSDSSQNFGHWKNDQYDKLVVQAASETDQAKRLDLYKQAAQIMVDDPPATYWYYAGRFRLVKPYVKGIVTTGQDGGFPGKFFLKDVTLTN